MIRRSSLRISSTCYVPRPESRNESASPVDNPHSKLTLLARILTILGAIVGILAMIVCAPEPSLAPPPGFPFWILLPFALVFWGVSKARASIERTTGACRRELPCARCIRNAPHSFRPAAHPSDPRVHVSPALADGVGPHGDRRLSRPQVLLGQAEPPFSQAVAFAGNDRYGSDMPYYDRCSTDQFAT